MTTSDKILTKFSSLKADLGILKSEFESFTSKSEKRFNKLYEIMDGLAGNFKKNLNSPSI